MQSWLRCVTHIVIATIASVAVDVCLEKSSHNLIYTPFLSQTSFTLVSDFFLHLVSIQQISASTISSGQNSVIFFIQYVPTNPSLWTSWMYFFGNRSGHNRNFQRQVAKFMKISTAVRSASPHRFVHQIGQQNDGPMDDQKAAAFLMLYMVMAVQEILMQNIQEKLQIKSDEDVMYHLCIDRTWESSWLIIFVKMSAHCCILPCSPFAVSWLAEMVRLSMDKIWRGSWQRVVI